MKIIQRIIDKMAAKIARKAKLLFSNMIYTAFLVIPQSSLATIEILANPLSENSVP